LIDKYELCLRGKFSALLSPILMKLLIESFEVEFPEASDRANKITEFCKAETVGSPDHVPRRQERGYTEIKPSELWQTEIDS
jgi:hypothetical protein